MTARLHQDELPGLDREAIATWLVDNVADVTPPVSFSLIIGGHSNLTYGAADGAGNQYVVRRGPLGHTGGRAHDMAREHRVITALDGAVPVPRTLALCEDPEVTGSPFYLMERVTGAALDSEEAADDHLPDPHARRRAGIQLAQVLARLHQVDVDRTGLGRAADRTDAVARQLSRFTAIWERTRTRDLPAVDQLARRLAAATPPQRSTGIVHGDYRVGNVLLDGTGHLTAVLDWELWTIGDVLSDLAFLLNSWYEPDDPEPQVFVTRPPTASGGFGSRGDVIERYVGLTGFDVDALGFHRAFQHWRMAIIAEGVRRRYETAQLAPSDVDRAHLDRRVIDLLDLSRLHLDRFVAGATEP